MIDQFGADQTRIIQDLMRRVQKLEAAQRSGPGLEIGQASGPFLLQDGFPSGLPSSGAYLFVSGTTLRARTTSGDEVVPYRSASIALPPNFQSGTATGTDAAVINQLRTDAAGTKLALDDLIIKQRAAGQIAT